MSSLKKYKIISLILLLCLFLLIVGSIFIGRYSININETLNTIKAVFQGGNKVRGSNIIIDIRLPRIIMSALIGCGLAVAGATLQAVLMNPMASPDILGTSSAAGFGSAVGILLFPNKFYLISLLSFAFGLFSIFIVFSLSKLKKNQNIISIILSGIIVSSLFMSLISLIKFIADTEETLPAITFWLMGSFTNIDMNQVLLSVPIILLCIFIIFKLRWKLNILSLGDEEAYMSGINPKKLRLVLLVLSSIIISISVTIAGIIGWVGLVIPHLIRTLIGENHGGLIPIATFSGGIFLLIIDNMARTMFISEIPIGILTALIGAPLFAILYIRGGNK